MIFINDSLGNRRQYILLLFVSTCLCLYECKCICALCLHPCLPFYNNNSGCQELVFGP